MFGALRYGLSQVVAAVAALRSNLLAAAGQQKRQAHETATLREMLGLVRTVFAKKERLRAFSHTLARSLSRTHTHTHTHTHTN